MWVGLIPLAISELDKGPGFRLCRGRFRLGVRRNLFTKRVIKGCNGLPLEAVESPCPEVLKKGWMCTQCPGLGDRVVLGRALGSMASQVLSCLADSLILRRWGRAAALPLSPPGRRCRVPVVWCLRGCSGSSTAPAVAACGSLRCGCRLRHRRWLLGCCVPLKPCGKEGRDPCGTERKVGIAVGQRRDKGELRVSSG